MGHRTFPYARQAAEGHLHTALDNRQGGAQVMGGSGQELVHMPRGVLQGQLVRSCFLPLARDPCVLGLVTEDGYSAGDTSNWVPQGRCAHVELYLAPIE